MQKKLFVLCIGMCALQAFAQDGFYVAPSVGTGMANVRANLDFYRGNYGTRVKPSAVFNYNARLGIGYGFGRWRLETGLQYARTGYRFKGLIMDTPPGDIITGKEETHYYHLSVPLSVAYDLPLGSRWCLSPRLGALVSYNSGARTMAEFPGFVHTNTAWTSGQFKEQRRSVSAWGAVSLLATYKVGNRVSVFAGPGLQYMLTDFLKPTVNSPYRPSERPYFFNINVGARIRISKLKPAIQAADTANVG